MESVKKNFFYSALYEILILIVPLITMPYISRVIGAEGVGIYTYTHSIVYYFILIAMLGINNYGNRTIAKVRENKQIVSDTFVSIYSLQFIMSIIMTILYIVYIYLFTDDYKWMYIIQLIYMVSVFFDINWFFFGMEKFKLTVTRNFIIKILSTILIFIFVKEKSDLWKYSIIMTLTLLISQVYLWLFLKKYIIITKENIINGFRNSWKHLKPCLILFVPVIAVSLYKIMDKVMLGYLSNMTEVGLYENAEKIVSIPLGLINALGTVMLPRMSNIIVKGKENELKKYISKSIEFMTFLTVPITLGIMAIGKSFAPLFFGIEFQKSGYLITYLSITIIFIGWANIIRTQYLIPKEKDKVYIYSVMLGAITNLILNSILIPQISSLGAVIGTVVAELVVMAVQIYLIRKEISIIKYLMKTIHFIIKAIIMYICLLLLEKLIITNLNSWMQIFIEILIGVVLYMVLNFTYIYRNIKFKKKGEITNG